jgi:hypothetical protein
MPFHPEWLDREGKSEELEPGRGGAQQQNPEDCTDIHDECRGWSESGEHDRRQGLSRMLAESSTTLLGACPVGCYAVLSTMLMNMYSRRWTGSRVMQKMCLCTICWASDCVQESATGTRVSWWGTRPPWGSVA